MIVPVLKNLKAVKDQTLRKPIYIGLGSVYGNKFSQGYPRHQAIVKFEQEWRDRLDSPIWNLWYKNSLRDLNGATLLCHCAPKPCHGDVLIKLFKEVFRDKLEVEDET